MTKNQLFKKACKWAEQGRLDKSGLCRELYHSDDLNKLLQIFVPTKTDIHEMLKKSHSTGHWGSGLLSYDFDKFTAFTPLRQTIVAFLLVIEEEYFE